MDGAKAGISSWTIRFFEKCTDLRRRTAVGVAVGLALTLVAFVIRQAIGDALVGYPFITFFPAVVLTTFLFGVRPGIVTAVACGLVSWYFFVPPYGTFVPVWPGTYLAIGFYTVVVGVDIFLIHLMDRAVLRWRRAEGETRRLLAQQEILFQELQHRVANNMALAASLLTQQARKMASNEGAEQALLKARDRLHHMAALHRALYEPAVLSRPLAEHLTRLIADLGATTDFAVTARVEVDEGLHLDLSDLMNLSLLVSEIVTNSLKHGYPDPSVAPVISLAMRRTAEGTTELRIADDGRGFDPAERRGDGLGSLIVTSLARQLGGTATWDAGPSGTTVILTLSPRDAAA